MIFNSIDYKIKCIFLDFSITVHLKCEYPISFIHNILDHVLIKINQHYCSLFYLHTSCFHIFPANKYLSKDNACYGGAKQIINSIPSQIENSILRLRYKLPAKYGTVMVRRFGQKKNIHCGISGSMELRALVYFTHVLYPHKNNTISDIRTSSKNLSSSTNSTLSIRLWLNRPRSIIEGSCARMRSSG